MFVRGCAKVAKNYSVARKTVQRIWKRYCATGSVDRLPCKGGKPKKITDDDVTYILAIVQENPSFQLSQIKAKFEESGERPSISLSTISHIVRKANGQE